MNEKTFYTDESVYKIGNMSYRLDSAPKHKLLKIYRRQKKNPDKMDPALITYVEENVEVWKAEAVVRGFRGLVDSLDQLIKEYIKVDKPKVVETRQRGDPDLSRKEQLSDICESGKIPYLSKSEARTALRNINAIDQEHKKPIRSYECDKCNWWHLTSLPIDKWKKQKKAK
ncbi:hypothetical protein GW765_03080 [Candidatus Parcubacteria bacterium]|nr:hypothetical protein [Candidatus Parcubacteria bacterium]